MNAKLVAKLREALEFFNDHPNFSLRFDRARTSYKIAADIDRLLKETAGAAPPIPVPPATAATAAPPAKPARFAEAANYTPLQMEAALCAWEWMLESREAASAPAISELWDGLGSSAMRMCSIQAGEIAAGVYAHMEAQGYEFIGAYDWEFVPDVLAKLDWSQLVDDNQYARARYDPDVGALFIAMVAADKSARPPGQRLFSKAAAS